MRCVAVLRIGNKCQEGAFMHEIFNGFEPYGWPFVYHYDVRKGKENTVIAHWHSNIELLRMLSGSGAITVDGKKYEMAVGDVFVINSDSIHSIYSEDMTYHCLIIDPDFCRQVGLPFDERRIQAKVVDKKICSIYDEIIQNLNGGELLSKPHAVQKTIECLLCLYEEYSEELEFGVKKAGDGIAKQAIAYVRNNISKKIELEEIADFLHISKFHLCREFKKQTGRTLVDCINSIKCKKAYLMLMNGSSITQAALASGYENLSYFSQIYKKQMGVLPSKVAIRARSAGTRNGNDVSYNTDIFTEDEE
jgi:AraC-like DNA-binding protein